MNQKNRRVKILCLRGVGARSTSASSHWIKKWRDVLNEKLLEEDGHEVVLEIEPVTYEDLFEDGFEGDEIKFWEALVSMGGPQIESVGRKIFRKENGLDPLAEALHWNAGMLYHWASSPWLRRDIRQRITEQIEAFEPDIILAHSLGSIVAYDAFLNEGEHLIRDRFFVTFGSQLGNSYVRTHFAGRLGGLPSAKHWYHLYNEEDSVFTAPLRLSDSNFTQVNTYFDNKDPLDHTAISTGHGTVQGYLDHFATRQLVWPDLLAQREQRTTVRSLKRLRSRIMESPDHRALLIGIDDYAHASIPNLSGCVNDTFLMSEMLQKAKFPKEQIRLLHNHRATADAIRDRLEWLLDDIDAAAGPDDAAECRLLYFSGHGAQLASYGVQEIADRLDECLCPHDFDWSLQTAILDDQICHLYSQLPYDSQLIIILDCCHAGGMARSGANIRGISNPLDVAHRSMEFKGNVWKSRDAREKRNVTVAVDGDEDKKHKIFDVGIGFPDDYSAERQRLFAGENGSLRRIGRAPSLRTATYDRHIRRSEKYGHNGPFLPVIFEACAEHESAQEHTQGSTTYGAFTFSFIQALKELGGPKTGIEYEALLEETKRQLKIIGYQQDPQLLKPGAKTSLPHFG